MAHLIPIYLCVFVAICSVVNGLVLPTPPMRTVPRVVPQNLPTIYVYDHCPFCVRVRLAVGLKNIKTNVEFLRNDGIKTPTELVGKKISPIW